ACEARQLAPRRRAPGQAARGVRWRTGSGGAPGRAADVASGRARQHARLDPLLDGRASRRVACHAVGALAADLGDGLGELSAVIDDADPVVGRMAGGQRRGPDELLVEGPTLWL